MINEEVQAMLYNLDVISTAATEAFKQARTAIEGGNVEKYLELLNKGVEYLDAATERFGDVGSAIEGRHVFDRTENN